VLSDLRGAKVTVMGLGLNGGGLASARFCSRAGAHVTVTDLRDETALKPSIKMLDGFPIRFVLGRHEMEDFAGADIVIKNPAVKRDSQFLSVARCIETDISLFLRFWKGPVFAVTGSKGKSTTVAALHSVLKEVYPDTKVGGNITISPLTYLEPLLPEDPEEEIEEFPLHDIQAPVVLELSSWQLADLSGKGILRPKIAVITNIMHDHQNYYTSMEEYVRDKKVIYENQGEGDATVINFDDPYAAEFARETRGSIYFFSKKPLPHGLPGAWLEKDGGVFSYGQGDAVQILPEHLSVIGEHNRLNLLIAGTCLVIFGLKPETIMAGLASFKGVEHRLEHVAEKRGISFVNDSAATIPEATCEAVKSFSSPIILVTGGTDKNLDYSSFEPAIRIPKAIYLVAGTATEKMMKVFETRGREAVHGPYASLEEAVEEAYKGASEGDTILFSPASTSFGMFLNEFDRGTRFKRIVSELPD